MVKEWSLNMTNNQFDLEAALAKLHEEDWLHPDQAALQDIPMEQETAIDKKYQQKSYWIAQFSHLLMNQYQQSNRACARILKQANHQYITRAIARYPTTDFETLTDIQKGLVSYAKTQGVKEYG